MKLGLVFAEVFKRCNSSRSFLNLVKEEERFASLDFSLFKQFQFGDNPIYIEIVIENGCVLGARFKVDVANIFKVF